MGIELFIAPGGGGASDVTVRASDLDSYLRELMFENVNIFEFQKLATVRNEDGTIIARPLWLEAESQISSITGTGFAPPVLNPPSAFFSRVGKVDYGSPSGGIFFRNPGTPDTLFDNTGGQNPFGSPTSVDGDGSGADQAIAQVFDANQFGGSSYEVSAISFPIQDVPAAGNEDLVIRIETDDGGGLPSGTLVDPNANVSVSPSDLAQKYMSDQTLALNFFNKVYFDDSFTLDPVANPTPHVVLQGAVPTLSQPYTIVRTSTGAFYTAEFSTRTSGSWAASGAGDSLMFALWVGGQTQAQLDLNTVNIGGHAVDGRMIINEPDEITPYITVIGDMSGGSGTKFRLYGRETIGSMVSFYDINFLAASGFSGSGTSSVDYQLQFDGGGYNSVNLFEDITP